MIGLTLRHDRLDNFWFCLMHELVHVDRHFTAAASRFYDDLDSDSARDAREEEADQLGGQALISDEEWANAPVRSVHSVDAVLDLATGLRIHPAIVAGRVRHESHRFRVFSQLLGQGQVRQLFPEVQWVKGA